MGLAIAGTYMTFLESAPGKYESGPLIVIGDEASGTVDGTTINKAGVGQNVTWSASDNNPSSANIAFASSSSGKTCYGAYVAGSGPLPSSNNLSGTSQPPPQTLTAWNGTYNTFVLNGTKWDKDSTLVVNAPMVTYNGKQILNPLYTGIKSTPPNPDVDQLAWFTGSGNADNVIISFIVSGSDKTFGGTKWASGSEPTASNFSGTTASTPTPPTITVEIVLALVVKVTAEAEVVEAEVVEAEVVEAEVVEVEVVEVEVIALVEEDKKPPGKGGPSGDPKADAKASDDLSSKASQLSGKKKPD